MRRTTKPPASPALVAAGALALTLGLAACGSTNGTSRKGEPQQSPGIGTATATPAPTGGGTTAAVPTTAPSTTEAADGTGAGAGTASTAASAAPLGSGALPGVPAVTSNATDLTKQPVVAAGTGTVGTGLVTRDLVVGTGTSATAADSVTVRYVGAIYKDATVFDTSWTRTPNTSDFPLSGVIPGFAQGIVGMKTGGRREIVIPPGPLGYEGGNAQAGIAADDTLIFIVDLVETGAS